MLEPSENSTNLRSGLRAFQNTKIFRKRFSSLRERAFWRFDFGQRSRIPNASCSNSNASSNDSHHPTVIFRELKKNGLRDSQNRLGIAFLVDSENPSGTLFFLTFLTKECVYPFKKK